MCTLEISDLYALTIDSCICGAGGRRPRRVYYTQQRYSAFTASFCEVGYILAWTPITESKVLNYTLIAESTVSSTAVVGRLLVSFTR